MQLLSEEELFQSYQAKINNFNNIFLVSCVSILFRLNKMSQIFDYSVRPKSNCLKAYRLLFVGSLPAIIIITIITKHNTYHSQLLDNPSPVLKQKVLYYLWKNAS